MIHPTAVIHPGARLGPDTAVGAYAVIDEDVILGAGCWVGPHVHLTGATTAGDRNRFHAGCVIGDTPQDAKFKGDRTRLRIGHDNVFREHVTVHRSNQAAEDTVIGDSNFFMAHCHVGHNCQIGDHVIVANGALLAGHVAVADRAFISGNCVIHQFCRIGRLALMQGQAAISKDLPPFCVARRDNGIAGLNTIGLRRAGITSADRLVLRRAYLRLFRTRDRLGVALAAIRSDLGGHSLVDELVTFVETSRRGVCADTGRSAEETD